MPTKQSSLPAPPFGSDKQIDSTSPLGKWMVQVQNAFLLRTVDTSGGSYAESVPPASQNQGQAISYVKVSPDGNTFTLNGVFGGAILITVQSPAGGAAVTIKSDGTNWYKVANP